MLFFLFSFTIGPDLVNYYYVYRSVTNPIQDMLTLHAMRNIGFTTLVFICKSIVDSFPFFIFVCNAIIFSLCGYTIYKHSESVLLSTLLFVGSGLLVIYFGSSIRQMIAMSLFFYAFYAYLPKKKYLYYEIVILIACTFHEVSFIGLFIPLIAICMPFIEKYKIQFMVGGSIFSVLFGVFLTRIIPEIAQFFGNGDFWLFHLFYYFTATPSISVMGLGMEIVFIAVILFLYWLSDSLKLNPIVHLEIAVSFIAFFVYLVFMRYSLISRICDFYQIIFLIMIPRLWSCIEKKEKKVIGLCVVALLNGFLLYSDLQYTVSLLNKIYETNYSLNNYPYTSIVSEVDCQSIINILEAN